MVSVVLCLSSLYQFLPENAVPSGLRNLAKLFKAKSLEEAFFFPLAQQMDATADCAKFNGEAKVDCFVRNKAVLHLNPVGTCRAGHSPENSVVDADFRFFPPFANTSCKVETTAIYSTYRETLGGGAKFFQRLNNGELLLNF